MFTIDIASQLTPYGSALDLEHASEIRLYQNADGPAAERFGEHARARPDPALPAERPRAGASADGSFLDRAASRRLDRGGDMFRADRPRSNVIQEPVVRLADDRVDRAHFFHARLVGQVLDEGVGDAPYA